MAYFRWLEGEMEGHLIATDEADARRQLDEPDDAILKLARLDGPHDGVDFREADAVLGDSHAAWLAQRRLGVSLTETPNQRSSHLGGTPRLDAEQAWPGGDVPLPLLLELELAELDADVGGTDLGLPKEGTLALFIDPERTSPAFAVRYTSMGAEPRSAPPGCPELPRRSLVGGLELTSPHPEDPALIELLGDDPELLDSYAAFYAEFATGGHCFLGHRRGFGGRDALEDGLIPLLQIRRDSGWCGETADERYLILLISEADLAALDFSRCRLVLQLD
ncbi:MAG: DUF1963 domain-containing protein [Myxococcales bacterium]|nr:DUF1963 domain-containing protein [Myxococcales bacterium]